MLILGMILKSKIQVYPTADPLCLWGMTSQIAFLLPQAIFFGTLFCLLGEVIQTHVAGGFPGVKLMTSF